MISALRQNTWVDYLVMSVAIIGITIPLFVIGPVLVYIFAMKLGWLPTSGWITGRYGWVTLIMPVITLSADKFAYIARLSRASFLEILRSDYIRTAKGKRIENINNTCKTCIKGRTSSCSQLSWTCFLICSYRIHSCRNSFPRSGSWKILCTVCIEQRLYTYTWNCSCLLSNIDSYELYS